ncbi:MAG: FdhF/YdeP family oxidoreductase [Bacteriovoracaceae bacterium]|jgi:molybdopterin-dependent oxidoreductase alpha subunit|nr:FdhF/YdeP family oxidoreductase [Bacteriovoracaceae bacterium]
MKKIKAVGGFHSIKYTFSMFFTLGFFKLAKAMLRKNTCKTCALGMGGQKGGMTNERGHFPELCKKTLQAMKSDMIGPIKENIFNNTSIEDLGKLSSRELDSLGRIPHPLYAKKSDSHFSKISYEEAFEKIAFRMKKTNPQKSFFYFSGRSSNEAGFLLQVLARIFGSNHVNNCSYYCHQASGVGLSQTIGSGTATLSLEDVEKCDLFFLIGGNPTSNHPRLLTTLMKLKNKGAKVIVINPVKEPGLIKFKIPSNIWSLFFGTKIADEYIQPHIGGDIAIINGMIKYLIENGTINESFINNYTDDFQDLKSYVLNLDWNEIEKDSGVLRTEISHIAQMYSESKNTVFSWTMGITHHKNGVENIKSIVNLALCRGMIGKKNAGLLPLRGHSNVQGMGTMAVTPKLKDIVFKNLIDLGFKLPTHDGYDTMACMEASYRSEIDFAWCLGGNLYGSNPDLVYAGQSISKIPTLLYMNTTLNQGHIYARGEETIILPVLARDEESQKTTQESMFNFLRLSDGGSKRISSLFSETEIIAQVGQRIFSESPIDWSEMRNHNNIRSLISKTIPGMENLKDINETKKEFTIPNRLIQTPKFFTPNAKAKFTVCKSISRTEKDTYTMMSVRSEGQYNTVVYEEEDSFRGIDRRDVILMNKHDIQKLKLKGDQKVTIKSPTNIMRNIRVREFNIKEGNTLMYFPECNILISRERDPISKTPGFKATEITISLN